MQSLTGFFSEHGDEKYSKHQSHSTIAVNCVITFITINKCIEMHTAKYIGQYHNFNKIVLRISTDISYWIKL